MRRRDYFQTSFYFLRKLNMMQKQAVCTLVSIYFDSPQLGIQSKQTVLNFRLFIDPEIYSNLIFQKRVWG